VSERPIDLIPLDRQAKRALRILLARDAIEDVRRPLDVLSRLEQRGLVKRSAHKEWDRRGVWDCYRTSLTDKGREAAVHA
jgi:hypothetical protein